MKNKFSDIIKIQEAVIKEQNKMFHLVGYGRLVFALLTAISLYFTFSGSGKKIYLIFAFAELCIFILLWIYHGKLGEGIRHAEGIIAINQRHLDRISGDWTSFADIGEEFIDHQHPYACDLDIVGKKSLFQYLNTTNTWHGRQAFANDLLHASFSPTKIKQRQQAILELVPDLEFSNEIEFHMSDIGTSDAVKNLVEELADKKDFIQNKFLKAILSYVPILSMVFILSTFLFKLEHLYPTAILCGLIQCLIWVGGLPKTQKYLVAANHLPYKLGAYSTVIQSIKERPFTSEILKQIQSQLGTLDLSADRAIKDLNKISNRLSFRNNAILYFFLNIMCLWDYQCAFLLEEWKQKYASSSEQWFLALGEFESLMSFSNLARVCDTVSMPNILKERQTITATEMGHPLIPNDVRVANDISFKDAIFIISGSNMSGKTTFLRTVGINLVLAQCGCFVCAGQMSFSNMGIITSMRIADDLNEGISTFYAELKRIKDIVELAKKQPDMIFLIDEIFRGTNSVDRLNGAKTVLKKLNDLGVSGIITTHDLELCKLSDTYQRISNYSFAEYYSNNEIHFDYKIKTGKSTTTNAKYLMELVGILS